MTGSFMLFDDETKAGDCLWITARKGFVFWPDEEEKKKYLISQKAAKKRTASTTLAAPPPIPHDFQKV